MSEREWSPEEWQTIARAQWDRWEADRKGSNQYIADQSRWIVAQLFIANGGALAGLVAAKDFRVGLIAAGGWFVTGLILALACGLLTWAHAQTIFLDISSRSPSVLVDQANWPKHEDPYDRTGKWLFWLSIFFGIGSLIMFIVGAWRVSEVISA